MAKKVIQLEFDTKFLMKGNDLVKSIQSQIDAVDLSKRLTRGLDADLNKAFRSLYSDLDKAQSLLQKKGLNMREYTTGFNNIITGMTKNVDIIKNAGLELEKIYKSNGNKEDLKILKEKKAILEEIKKIQTSMRQSETSRSKKAGRLQDEFGLDITNDYTRRTLKGLSERRAAKGARAAGITDTERAVLGKNADNPEAIRQIIELLKEEAAQYDKVKEKKKAMQELATEAGVKSSFDNIIPSLESMIGKLENGVISTQEFNNSMKALGFTEEQIAQLTPLLIKGMDESGDAAKRNADKMAKATQSIKEVLAQFGIILSAGSMARAFKNLIKESFEFYKSLDSALNQIYVVSNLSSGAVNNLQDSFINMAKNTGMALDDVTRSAVLFYQQGLSTDEVLTMTEVTAQFAKVAGIDATDAANKLTAAVNGYCLAAEDAASVADKFNKVAASSAADINELSTAFSKAAAQANQAGVSMDNYLAYIATMEEATREAPENIGTGLKTIFSRMQQIKKGENTDDNVDINQVETALRSVGIQLRDTTGQLRDLEEVFDELGPKWNSLDRNTQAYLGTIIAGTRQQSRFITLMQNWDRVQELADESANSAGQQALMHAKAMESIESKLNQLNVAWQEFVSNIASSDLFKGIIDTLKSFLNLINGGNKPMMLLATAVGLLGNKLKDLQMPLKEKMKDFKNWFSGDKNANKLKFSEKREKLKENEDKQNELKNIIAENNQIIQQEQIKGNLESERVLELKKENETHEENLKKLKEQREIIKNTNTTLSNFGSKLKGIGMLTSAVGLAVGQSDEVLGGMISGGGVMATGVGQMLTGNYIGGAISLITGGFEFFTAMDKAAEAARQKMVDAVEQVKKETEELSKKTTMTKNVKGLIDKYNELYNKTYRTTKEQEELNNVIQEMGDSLDIQTITDDYGNLTISLEEVRQKYEELFEQQEEALKKMKEVEREQMEEATSGFMNDNTEAEYIEKIYKENSAEYKKLLTGITDNMSDKDRGISKSLFSSFNNEFKKSIADNINAYKEFYYYGEGFAESFVNLEKDINNSLMNTDKGWDYVYKQINYFKQNIDDMNWEEFSQKFSKAFEAWRIEIGLTTDQWMTLKNAIQSTIYGSQEYVDYMNKFDTTNGRREELQSLITEHETKLIDKYKDAYITMQAERKHLIDFDGGINFFTAEDIDVLEEYLETQRGLGNNLSEKEIKEISKKYRSGKGFQELYKWWTDHGKEFDYKDDWTEWDLGHEYEALKGGDMKKLEDELKQYDALIQKRDKLIEELGKGGAKLFTALSQLKGESVNYVRSIGSLFSESEFLYGEEDSEEDKKMKDDAKERFRTMAADVAESAKEWSKDSDIGLAMMKSIDEQIKATESDTTLDEDMKNILLNKLNKAKSEIENKMPTVQQFTWTGIIDSLDSYAKGLQTVNSAMDELNDKGAIANDTFRDLASVMDSLNLEEIYESFSSAEEGLDYINKLTEAMKNMKPEYDANTGLVRVNKEALEQLQDAQEKQVKGKIKAMINDLAATKASIESNIAYIDAQIAAISHMEDAIDTESDKVIDTNQLMSEANSIYTDTLATEMDKVSENYKKLTESSLEWAKESIYQISEVTDAWSKYWQAVRDGAVNAGELRKQADELTSQFTVQKYFEDSGFDVSAYDNVKMNSAKGKELKQKLAEKRQALEATRAEYSKSLGLYEGRINYLQTLLDSDLSQWGMGGKGSSKDSLNKYIGQLKEIYNILNRIGVLEHRLSTLDTYSDIAQGKEYGELLGERLEYNEELLDQYRFLVSEQKQFTNGYKDFIGTVDGLEGVFDFDKFGQIIINWEKYSKLQDTAAKGEVSLKEKADDVYNTYTSMFKELQGYFDNYIKYLQNILKLLNETRDAYVNLENKTATAIKEIYQKILNTKLEAIDAEKEALDDLKKAREQANKDTKNAKELSGMQTNLQRALMDTSGASDSAFIKAQMDMNNKLDEIAEDKYSSMIQDLQTTLEDEKEMLQKEFDEMFDNLDWLFDFLDTSIMSDPDSIQNILKQTDEWNQKSPTEKWQDMRDWDKMFSTYFENEIFSEKGIKGVLQEIEKNEARIAEIDQVLKNQNTKGDANIIQTLEKWGSNISGAVSSAVSRANSGGGGGGGNGGNNTNNNKTTSKYGTYTKDSIKAYNVPINEDVAFGTFSTTSDDNKRYQPNNVGGVPLKSTGKKAVALGITSNSSKFDVSGQNIWTTNNKDFYIWNGTKGIYENVMDLLGRYGNDPLWSSSIQKQLGLKGYSLGGLVDFTGPAVLHGSSTQPEAVLNALQTKHFIDFADALSKMYSGVNGATPTMGNSINVGSISFEVESMSSPEDGERAFNMFVDKFKEIGNQTGIKINTFKNTL